MSAQAHRAYARYAEVIEAELAKAERPPAVPAITLPPFEELPEYMQEAWREGIAAAVDEPRAPETLTDKQVRLLDEMGTAALGRKIKAMMPPDKGFLFWTVDYGAGGNIAYVSTCNRDDAIRTVREWLKHQGAL